MCQNCSPSLALNNVNHRFWRCIWQSFWHSICHSFWHSIWHSFWHFICHFCPWASQGVLSQFQFLAVPWTSGRESIIPVSVFGRPWVSGRESIIPVSVFGRPWGVHYPSFSFWLSLRCLADPSLCLAAVSVVLLKFEGKSSVALWATLREKVWRKKPPLRYAMPNKKDFTTDIYLCFEVA